MNRRLFLKSGGLALLGSAVMPDVFVRMVQAGTTGGSKVLVAIFQRGAVDGLNMIVPYGESAYYAARRTISIPKEKTLDLDGFFGAHPSMKSLMPFWKERSLAAVHAAGSPNATRSHFDAQDFMESGTPGVKSTADGFLARALASGKKGSGSPVRAVALGSAMPRILRGSSEAIATPDISTFRINGGRAGESFESMYAESVAGALGDTARQSFEAARLLAAIETTPSRARYPRGALADSLRQIAQLIRSDVGLEVAFTDAGGWDTHAGQGGEEGRFALELRNFSEAIAAFVADLGSRMSDVVLVTMSEFGRTVRENGNRGTDHGHGTVMLALGGGVRGGKVRGHWPGLERERLFEERDLAVTTDFRDVFSEILASHLRVPSLGQVFPGHKPERVGLMSA